jgi:hypothetical protein
MKLVILLCFSAHMPSVILLMRLRRIAAGSGLSTGLRTAGNILGTTIKHLGRKRNGASGYGLDTTTKYL